MKLYYIGWFIVLFCMGGCTTRHYVYAQSKIISQPYATPYLPEETKQAYISAVNRMRQSGAYCGNLGYFPPTSPLRWNNALYHAAYEHSADMSDANTFTHEGSRTITDWTMRVQHLGHASNFTDRIENNGYKQWKRLAQNIAAGKSSISETMEQWITSEHHCKNIMNPVFTEFGMAHTYSSDTRYHHYWTQNFAAHQ